MLEGQTVCRFIHDLLASDVGVGGVSNLVDGRINRDRIPEGGALPAITITLVDAPDFNAHDGSHIAQDVEVDVAVRGDGETYDEVDPIARRVFTVLQEASGTQDGVYVVRLRRTGTRAFMNSSRSKGYVHVVQTFFTEAEPA